jgi:carbon storage regulator
MLVLARKRGEEIVIGEPGPDQITICVLRFDRDGVRLGITAPADVPVHRLETERKIRENEHP